VLAVDLHEPDEFFQFSGAPGFDREILEGFARLHAVRLEPVAVSAWDDLVPALAADRGDVIAGRFTVTDERKRRIAFTRETFPTRNVVLTRQPAPAVKSLEGLRALRVGTGARIQHGRGGGAGRRAARERGRHDPSWNRLAVKYFGDSAPEVLRKARE
jgi:membrane-bound lytic murein transglycosylase MltF